MTLEERFWLKVNKNGSQILDTVCWEWTGKIKSGKEGGYGIISIADYASERRSTRRFNRKDLRAHRVSWELHNGEIFDGLLVCHRCDNRRCVNPIHLFLGTSQDNLSDMAQKLRSTIGEKNPRHKLTRKQVDELRHLSKSLSRAELAALFNIHKMHIGKILRREQWK